MKILLTFICRNNADVIERMLDSCKSIIDGVCAVDTGSTDTTIKIINAWCRKNNIPGAVYGSDWLNFGHNRTQMMRYAQSFYEEKDTFDYILVMDTDETLQIKGDLNLVGDIGMIKTISGNMEYYRDRFFSTKHIWKWIGYAHEYPHSDTFQTKQNIENLYLELDAKIGNAHIERNLKLLKLEESDGFATPRTFFYLAQSSRDLGYKVEALNYYQKCIETTTWDEEKFFAQYDQGRISHGLEKTEDAQKQYLSAWETSKGKRAEPLYNLAVMLRGKGKYYEAGMYITMAMKVKKPEDGLFLEWAVYEYLIRFEYSINLYWRGEYELAYLNSRELVTPDESINEQNRKNIVFTTRKLIKQGWKEELIIQLPDGYDGLGDHLFFSHIPELAKKAGYKIVTVSKKNTFKTKGTVDLVWSENPFVDNFTIHYGPYHDNQDLIDLLHGNPKIPGMNMLKQIAIIYGVYHEDYNGLPIVYKGNRKSVFDNTEDLIDIELGRTESIEKKTILFDGNWKHYIGITQQEVSEYFTTNRSIYNTYKGIYAIHNAGKALICNLNAQELKPMSINEYVSSIIMTARFICLMSGGSVLSAALGKPCIVIDNDKTSWYYKFPQINFYTSLIKEKDAE